MGLLKKLAGKLFGIEGYQIIVTTVKTDGVYEHKVSKKVYSNPHNDDFEKIIEIAKRASESVIRDYELSHPYNPNFIEFAPLEITHTITK